MSSVRPDIDPRGPRLGAGITAGLLLVVIGLALAGAATAAFVLFAAIAVLFAFGALAGAAKHPYGLLFRKLVRPRLGAPTHLEDPRPPTFSQGVGLVVTLSGILLSLLGVPFAIVVCATLAFVAAFLNSAFDYCIGCQLYLLLVRARILGRTDSAAQTRARRLRDIG